MSCNYSGTIYFISHSSVQETTLVIKARRDLMPEIRLEIVGKVRGVEVSEAAPLNLHSGEHAAATTIPTSQLPGDQTWNLEFGCHRLAQL